MSDTNVIVFSGRLGANPEMKGQNGNFSVFRVCSTKKYTQNNQTQEKNTWVRVKAFNGNANFASGHLRKGDKVTITGELDENRWQDQQGNNRSQLEVTASRIERTALGQEAQAMYNGQQQGQTMPPQGQQPDQGQPPAQPAPPPQGQPQGQQPQQGQAPAQGQPPQQPAPGTVPHQDIPF